MGDKKIFICFSNNERCINDSYTNNINNSFKIYQSMTIIYLSCCLRHLYIWLKHHDIPLLIVSKMLHCGSPSVRPFGRHAFSACTLPAQQACSPLPSFMASQKTATFRTCTAVVAFPAARPPLAFSSEIVALAAGKAPARRELLQCGSASPREAALARPLLPPPI
jgi:hypothetical protein